MSVPRHIAVIMDGNRRFSRRLLMQPWKGHEWGANKIEEFARWCGELGVRELTLYAFSIQNFSRPAEEFTMLMRVFQETVARIHDRLTQPGDEFTNVRVRFIGRRSLFPEDVQASMASLEAATAHHEGLLITVAMGYGGREEIVDAVKAIAERVAAGTLLPAAIDESVVAGALSQQSEPDLVIRTGGERRISNFLLWQTSYSEWVFLDTFWPELSRAEFEQALAEYAARERRYGA